MATKKQIIYICTHGKFGEELIRSAEMIVGKLDGVKAFSLIPGMSPEEYQILIEDSLKLEGESIIVMVDLFGGTPSNTMAILSKKYKLDILSGINLAMLIELYTQKDNLPTDKLLALGLSALQDSGKNVLEVLRKVN
ncbi:MAG: PTS mannose transporter subunit IIA [Erysipelotrichaceae bacterium]